MLGGDFEVDNNVTFGQINRDELKTSWTIVCYKTSNIFLISLGSNIVYDISDKMESWSKKCF